MSRTDNTVGAPGEFDPLASIAEITYLLFVCEQAYLPYLKKSLMKSTIVGRNAWEINTSFYFLNSRTDDDKFVPSKALLM